MQERYQGRSLNRLEDHRFLTGHGKYVANDHVPGVLHAHVVRSPVAFARIARLDLAAARALPGVVAVYSEADLAADGIGELPCITVIEAIEPIIVPIWSTNFATFGSAPEAFERCCRAAIAARRA